MDAVAERGNHVLVQIDEGSSGPFAQPRGVVVNTRRGTVSEPGLVASILARGYWTPFSGDPQPILALVQQGFTAAGFDESKHKRHPKGTPVRGREGGGRFAPKEAAEQAEGEREELSGTPSWLGTNALTPEDAYYKATKPREAVAIARGWLKEEGITESAQGVPLEDLGNTGVVALMEQHYPDGYEFFLSINDLHKEDFRRNYLRNGEYVPERAAYHNGIRAKFLEHAQLPQDGEPPMALFMAGGSGAGKSSILGKQVDGVWQDSLIEGVPDHSVYVNPDDIKEMLPEAQVLRDRDDMRWAALAHEESSDIAARLRKDAEQVGFPMVIDGTGDAAPGKFLGKIQDAEKAGYRTKVVFVDIPTEEAIRRAEERAVKTKRKVSREAIRDIHRNVTQRHLEWRDQVDNWEVWANDDAADGGRRLIARRINGGEIEYIDEPRYAQMAEKAKES
jgi:predicted ABC-type ATPase